MIRDIGLTPDEVIRTKFRQTIEVCKMTISLRGRIQQNPNAVRKANIHYLMEG